jgi:segregation and condensation protein B
MEESQLKNIIEAILFTSGKTVRKEEIMPVFEGRVSPEEFDRAVNVLKEDYSKSSGSFSLEEVAHGYRLITRPEFGGWLKLFYKDKHKRRLSSASLESLAVIAYKQPVTRLEIESIRGVNCEGVLHSLLEVGLIRIMGYKQVPGRPMLYGTTNRFLELFGLKNLSDLPPLDELEKMLKEKEKKIEEEGDTDIQEKIPEEGKEGGEDESQEDTQFHRQD